MTFENATEDVMRTTLSCNKAILLYQGNLRTGPRVGQRSAILFDESPEDLGNVTSRLQAALV